MLHSRLVRRMTAKEYLAASVFFDLLSIFGPLETEVGCLLNYAGTMSETRLRLSRSPKRSHTRNGRLHQLQKPFEKVASLHPDQRKGRSRILNQTRLSRRRFRMRTMLWLITMFCRLNWIMQPGMQMVTAEMTSCPQYQQTLQRHTHYLIRLLQPMISLRLPKTSMTITTHQVAFLLHLQHTIRQSSSSLLRLSSSPQDDPPMSPQPRLHPLRRHQRRKRRSGHPSHLLWTRQL